MQQIIKKGSATLLTILTLAFSMHVVAADEYLLVIKDHTFEPAEIKIPAGQKVKLTIHNQDSTPEEFHSDDLKREKVVLGGKKATISIGPLKAGSYNFMGEFHEATAKGRVIAE